jgi:hypothetical protein
VVFSGVGHLVFKGFYTDKQPFSWSFYDRIGIWHFSFSETLSVLLVPSVPSVRNTDKYNQTQISREFTTVSVLRFEIFNQSPFYFLPLRIFLYLFCIPCPGFLVVVSGKIRENYLHSIFSGLEFSKNNLFK